ncbi:hypothetical protein Tco_0290765 [Tanacetum coccineum]
MGEVQISECTISKERVTIESELNVVRLHRDARGVGATYWDSQKAKHEEWGKAICPTDESICYRCTLDVRLLVGSPGASTAPIYSLGSSSTPIYSPGSSTPPRYSPGASTPPSYSLGTSRNVECSNCKHLLKLQAILWELQEMQNVIRML